MRKFQYIAVFLILGVFTAKSFGALTGNGTSSSPYLIRNLAEFQDFCGNPAYWAGGVHTRLDADIDLASLPTYTRAPIAGDESTVLFGFNGTEYAGRFDGNRHVIRNLTINGASYCGLFGKTLPSTLITNLGVENVSVVGSGAEIAAIVGYNDGQITNSYSSGIISGNNRVGGVAGTNIGSIKSCYSAASVNGTGRVGGLVGINGGIADVYGHISNCYSTGPATSSNESVGGLIGYNYERGTVRYCYTSSLVTGPGNKAALIGYDRSSGTLTADSFWNTETSGMTDGVGAQNPDPESIVGITIAEMKTKSTFTDAGWDFNNTWWISDGLEFPRLRFEYTYAGGEGTEANPFEIATPVQLDSIRDDPSVWDKNFILVSDIDMTGYNYDRAVIAYDTDNSTFQFEGVVFSGSFAGNNHVISNLTVDGVNYCGLFGMTSGSTITNLGLENASIYGSDDNVGALAGVNGGSVSNCYATGSVDGFFAVGCLIGSNSGSVTNSHSNGTAYGGISAGGLVGHNGGIITNCLSTGGANGNDAGGLVGSNGGNITQSYSTGGASGSSGIGSLAGANSGSISGCYSNGSAYGDENVGGFVGRNRGSITDSYSNGSADGLTNIGGFTGKNAYDGTIVNCYSTGSVYGDVQAGGFVGLNETIDGNSNVTRCFWDTEASGQETSPGGTGKTTAQMQTRSTFTGWDFFGNNTDGTDDTWRLCVDGSRYPHLRWNDFQRGDIECPDGVSVEDLTYLVDRWLAEGELTGYADINGDGIVNQVDFSEIGGNWLKD